METIFNGFKLYFKGLPHRCLPVIFEKHFRTAFLQNTCERLVPEIKNSFFIQKQCSKNRLMSGNLKKKLIYLTQHPELD